eukprot:Rhum_TRINITY_DN2161_c0_g1::Rhum_TRINITY_DN2161_c0_g1_i1::g.6141::m.6141
MGVRVSVSRVRVPLEGQLLRQRQHRAGAPDSGGRSRRRDGGEVVEDVEGNGGAAALRAAAALLWRRRRAHGAHDLHPRLGERRERRVGCLPRAAAAAASTKRVGIDGRQRRGPLPRLRRGCRRRLLLLLEQRPRQWHLEQRAVARRRVAPAVDQQPRRGPLRRPRCEDRTAHRARRELEPARGAAPPARRRPCAARRTRSRQRRAGGRRRGLSGPLPHHAALRRVRRTAARARHQASGVDVAQHRVPAVLARLHDGAPEDHDRVRLLDEHGAEPHTWARLRRQRERHRRHLHTPPPLRREAQLVQVVEVRAGRVAPPEHVHALVALPLRGHHARVPPPCRRRVPPHVAQPLVRAGKVRRRGRRGRHQPHREEVVRHAVLGVPAEQHGARRVEGVRDRRVAPTAEGTPAGAAGGAAAAADVARRRLARIREGDLHAVGAEVEEGGGDRQGARVEHAAVKGHHILSPVAQHARAVRKHLRRLEAARGHPARNVAPRAVGAQVEDAAAALVDTLLAAAEASVQEKATAGHGCEGVAADAAGPGGCVHFAGGG